MFVLPVIVECSGSCGVIGHRSEGNKKKNLVYINKIRLLLTVVDPAFKEMSRTISKLTSIWSFSASSRNLGVCSPDTLSPSTMNRSDVAAIPFLVAKASNIF